MVEYVGPACMQAGILPCQSNHEGCLQSQPTDSIVWGRNEIDHLTNFPHPQ